LASTKDLNLVDCTLMQSVHNVCKQITDKNVLSIHAKSNVPIEGDFCSGVFLDILLSYEIRFVWLLILSC